MANVLALSHQLSEASLLVPFLQAGERSFRCSLSFVCLSYQILSSLVERDLSADKFSSLSGAENRLVVSFVQLGFYFARNQITT